MPDTPLLRKQWQVPPFGSDPKAIATWAAQQVTDGIEFQKTEPGYKDLEESIRILSNDPDEYLALKQQDKRYTRVRTNRLKRNLREMVTSLSDIRYAPGFHAGANEWQAQAGVFNKLGASWYVDRFIDIRIKEAVQWMAISKRGWLELCYRRIPGERNRANIDAIPMPDCDVVMTGVPASRDFQEAYTVTLIKDLPVYLAHSLFPDDTAKLIPNKETPQGWRERIRQAFNDVFAPGPELSTAKNPTCTLYYTYVNDFSIHRGSTPKKMGYEKGEDGREIETPWSYTVPPLGGGIPVGRLADGTVTYRKALREDCRLFPGRRLIITSETSDTPLYDGPMFEWHGRVPLIRLTGDSWPFGDYSMVHDVAPIHEAVNEIDRISHQTLRNRFNPSMLYNMKAVTRDKAKSMRTDIQGQRIGFNGDASANPVQPLLPKDFNVIEGWVEDFRKYLNEEEDYEMGVRDITALAKMKSGAGLDSLEKALEQAGPIVKSIARDMERQMRDFAEMFKWLVLQYYTTPRIMRVVGLDGITPENFDFQPGNLIPSHLPGESPLHGLSLFSLRERAQYLADNVSFFITPNTLHEMVQTTQKLIFLQLSRSGLVPIDPWTLAEVFRIGNFGKVPSGADSIMERYFAWEELKAEKTLALMAKIKKLQEELGLDPEQVPHGMGGGGAPGLGPKGGNKGTGGRAPSGQTAPKLQQKGDGRPLMRESP
jgi:hypothetical protein